MAAGFTLTVLALGAAPRAQATYGELDVTYPYTSLGSAGAPLSGVSGVANGLAVVPLSGWSFPFAGQNFSEITVTSDGYLTVGDATATCGCAVGASSDNCAYCPSSPPLAGPVTYLGAPTYSDTIEFEPPFFPGLIAPWWEDSSETVENYYGSVQPTTTLGTISTLQGGPPGSKYLIVDYSQVGPYADPPCTDVFTPPDSYSEVCTFTPMPRTFQVQLFESGAIVFTYGTMDGTIEVPNWGEVEDTNAAIVGVWAPATFDAGLAWTDAGTMFGPSGTNGNAGCMIAGWESLSNGEEFCEPYTDSALVGSAYIGELEAPFLTSAPVPVPEVSANGVVINVALTVNNKGTSSQPQGFPVDFFLVSQAEPPFGLPTTCVAPMCLGQEAFGDAIKAGGQSVYTTTNGFALPNPLPPSGYYAIASVIDPANTTVNATAPLLEIGTSTQLLPFGQDLTGKIELTTFSVDAGADFTVPLEFTNLGLETADSASYTLSFVDGAGHTTQAATGNLTDIGGLSSTLVNQDVPIPSSLAAGIYQLQLVIDTGSPTDLNPLNNTILGIQRVENGQDMTASIGAAPFAIPTPTTFSVPVTFKNLGLQQANSIAWTMSLTSANGTTTPIGGGKVTLAGLMSEEQMLPATITQTLPSGPYTLSLQLSANSLGSSLPNTPDLNTANNTVIDPTPVFVYSAGADYEVGPGDLSLIGPPHAADGQEIGVWRTIHNLDGPAGPCPYSYFLNPLGVTQIGNGVPVAIVTKTGASFIGMTGAFAAFGQPGAQDTRTEQILIPPGMPAGAYNLVLAVDPENQVADTNPSNNDVATQINISANPVQITSPSSLQAAIVNTPYLYQLIETGAGTQPSWSLLAGSLPAGITLDPAGFLSGTPTQPGVFAIVVQVSSPNGTQVALLDLPVASGSGALSIEQSSPYLPTAIVGSQYEQQLEAQGGVPPYTWAGTVPAALDGLTLNSSGLFSGTPTTTTDGPVQFTVIVTDAIGTQATAPMSLRIIAPAGLVITTPFLNPAVVGTQYNQPIIAAEADSSMVTFNWSLPPGTVLPAGIMFAQLGTPAIADFSGKPTQAGIFPVVLNLLDNFGHNATRQYILTVASAPIPVSQQTLPVAVIGATYITQLQANSLSTLTWGIFSGALPLGLALTPAGTISGTVDSSVVPGVDSFAVSVSDDTGAESVVPLYIQVQAPSPPSGGGCATGGGPAGAGLLWLAVIWFGSRNRRRDGRGRI